MSPRSYKQELVGLFGQPVAENPTQAMIEAAFRHHDLAWRYLTIEVAPERLGDAVRGARAMGFAGFHCTIPHKVAVLEHVDEIAPSASLIGAVNCVVARGDRLVGANTDGRGFLTSVRPLLELNGANVVVLGAGGAARAVAVELALAGARRMTIVNRGTARGAALAALLDGPVRAHAAPALTVRFVSLEDGYAVRADADLVVNATSIGLAPDADADVPADLSALRADAVVADVIPAGDTPFLRRARAAGRRAVDGLGMLVAQGELAIELWAGIAPDADVMRGALLDALEVAG
jgi:shikimate dehydrogenase